MTRTISNPEICIELGDELEPGQRFASITLGGVTLFSDLVYDVPGNEAERGILLLFGLRLSRLLEDK